ncbi:MAG: phosphoadenosine phosphosulfate reductase family protein [Candidatus Fermentithermobacillus carboniphilus]|uniref:Phosphoadenosine phosphosulfate reductase family protein n=1 Tax=Candidatus Fermentithermobacillus carboniphilus TaxID=3085328 RepID=A0AAT9LC75_9FIRM|nr:MAG: phosphoadenosine phosphosulfate reductase family protein [Candidatus Fermentithermobacillus carboniphilus]
MTDTRDITVGNEIRPVFYEELDLLGFSQHWSYQRVEEPLLWAIGGRKYYYKGELVAEAEGGGLFTRPTLKVYRDGLVLEPVDVDGMLEKNKALLQGLVQRSMKFIWQTYGKYQNKVDVTAVAFSGGKDSIVTLDLVQRTLEPSQFVVVFGDTGMEVQDTYEAVKAAQERWPQLSFYTARSKKDALTMWREMGPPSRIHRWCCTVHKTAPSLLLLRQLTGKASAMALVFDGVRHEESASRSNYDEITQGGKHKTQVNASPIIRWNSGEVFLYLFDRHLMLNRAYRHGVVRVGCAICPMAAKWWDIVSWRVYSEDMRAFVEELRNYAASAGINVSDIDRFVEDGGWKRRAGGRYLPSGGNRVLEHKEGNKTTFTLHHPTENWLEWAKTLGRIVQTGETQGLIESKNGTVYPYVMQRFDNSVVVEIQNLAQADRYVISAFRAVALKAAYCTHCQACQVECPTGALQIRDDVRIGEGCVSCGMCLDMRGRACLAAESLKTSEGGIALQGCDKRTLHTYQHFGMKRDWLAEFFSLKRQWASKNGLGTCQFDAMLMWLKHAELIEGDRKSLTITDLVNTLVKRGVDDLTTWAVIWTNLARNSTPVRWYVTAIPWGTVISKDELVRRMGEYFPQSESTRRNAVKALYTLLTETPLASGLGLAEKLSTEEATNGVFLKRGWQEPNPVAVLYSLYRYAEKTGRYELTVSELYGEAEEGPYILFGTERETLVAILRGLSLEKNDLIRTDIVRDLDNIFLDRNRKAIEVLDLV